MAVGSGPIMAVDMKSLHLMWVLGENFSFSLSFARNHLSLSPIISLVSERTKPFFPITGVLRGWFSDFL